MPVMQDRDQKRAPQGCGGSLEQGQQGPDGRQRLPFIMGCQRLGELTELGAGDGATTDALDQGSERASALLAGRFLHEPTQHRDQTSRAGVGGIPERFASTAASACR